MVLSKSRDARRGRCGLAALAKAVGVTLAATSAQLADSDYCASDLRCFVFSGAGCGTGEALEQFQMARQVD